MFLFVKYIVEQENSDRRFGLVIVEKKFYFYLFNVLVIIFFIAVATLSYS